MNTGFHGFSRAGRGKGPVLTEEQIQKVEKMLSEFLKTEDSLVKPITRDRILDSKKFFNKAFELFETPDKLADWLFRRVDVRETKGGFSFGGVAKVGEDVYITGVQHEVRDAIDSYAAEILEQELGKDEPDENVMHRTVYWLSGAQRLKFGTKNEKALEVLGKMAREHSQKPWFSKIKAWIEEAREKAAKK